MKKYLAVGLVFIVIFSAFFGFAIGVASKFALFDMFISLSSTTPFFPEANIMLLGVDNAFGHRSDTIMVLHTNPGNKSASLISIPRDTLAVLPGRGLDKVNHAYAYGGIDLARQTLEKLLSIKIPYYIVVNLAGITNLIDELGGVTIDVEKRMYYVDYAGELYINLKPGVQRLSGKDAMGYLRYRSDGGDFSRINRQQKFLQALASEMIKADNRLRSPKLFLTLLSYLHTNLKSKETLGLSLGMRAAHEVGQIYMATLPGYDMLVDGIYYWKPDQNRLEELVNKYIRNKNIEFLSSTDFLHQGTNRRIGN